MSLRAEQLGVHAGTRWLIRDVGLELHPGRLCVLLGGNGAGKTTLLRALAGDITLDEGAVSLDGRALAQWAPRALAQRRAVLTQHDSLRFPFTAAEVVGLSGLPWAGSSARHRAGIVTAALTVARAAEFANRLYTQLSGGERGRVRFARALAQIWEQPDGVLLLDEPVAHFDFAHQHHCMEQARTRARAGLSVLAVLHDPNLAMRYADDVAMLRDGRLIGSGPAGELLTAQRLSVLYDTAVEALTDSAGHSFFHAASGRASEAAS